jgi:hypothetical protein
MILTTLPQANSRRSKTSYGAVRFDAFVARAQHENVHPPCYLKSKLKRKSLLTARD